MAKGRTSLGDWLPEKPPAQEPAIPPQGKATLDVDQALVEIHRKRAKGNATAGVVNAILLEGLDNDILSREARAAIAECPDKTAQTAIVNKIKRTCGRCLNNDPVLIEDWEVVHSNPIKPCPAAPFWRVLEELDKRS